MTGAVDPVTPPEPDEPVAEPSPSGEKAPGTFAGTKARRAGELVLIRHGETEWSKSGQHTGMTDLPLTDHGKEVATAIRPLIEGREFVLTLSSPLERARHTAELAGLTPQIDPDLVEWDYGGYEGRTTADIRKELGHPWAVFNDGVIPGKTPGETVEEVAARMSRVLVKVEAALEEGDVVIVGHGHALRILTAVYLRQEVRFGAQIPFAAGAISILGKEKEFPALLAWNRLPDVALG